MLLSDRIVSWFSPKLAYKRMVARGAQRKYEAASHSKRLGNWRAPGTSADTEADYSLTTLRNRARDLVRNNAYAARGISVIANNVVGAGIVANISGKSRNREKRIENLWNLWADTTACDFAGRLNFAGIQNQIMRAVAESGECLVRIRRVNDMIPMKLQVLESDFIADNLTARADNGNQMRNGIEFNSAGNVVAYHLFTRHPGDYNFTTTSVTETVRVPVEDIAHIYRSDRPGQTRGITWLAPVMLRMKDIDEFSDATLLRQKIANCFAAFITDMEAPDVYTECDDDFGKFEPGQIELLPPGKEIKFANPPHAVAYKEYTSALLHEVAAGLGVTYEAMTGDLEGVNFSSARMGWLEFQRNIDTWRKCMIMPALDQIFNWFLDSVDLVGESTAGITVGWVPPRREMIDPTKEVAAKIRAVRAGVETLSDVVRQSGKRPDRHFEEFAQDMELLDQLGLVLDTDPRKTMQSGTQQQSTLEVNQ